MTKLLKYIYVGSVLPLLIGSITYFYWYFKRSWFAENLDITVFAITIIFGFIIMAVITLILCALFVFKNKTSWKKVIVPISIVVLTVPFINNYASTYKIISKMAFIRIINNTNYNINKIWSDDDLIWGVTKKGNDIIVSFYPVYINDWTKKKGEGNYTYPHKVNPVFVDLLSGNDSIMTYELPIISKGDCKTYQLSDLMKIKTSAKMISSK